MRILVYVHLLHSCHFALFYSLLSQSLLITTVALAYHVLLIIIIRTLIIGVTVVGYEFGRGGDLEFDRLLSSGFTIALNCYLSLSMLMLTMSPSGGSGGPPPDFFLTEYM